MATAFHPETAKIYQFPVGGRKTFEQRKDASRKDLDLADMPQVDFGSWYHDEAIRESEPPRKS